MLILIPTPIGNILDITYRTVETLKTIEVIFCEDTRVTKSLLKLLQERFEISLPDFEIISFNEHNASKRLKEYQDVIELKRCAYMSDAGMPAISDPGAELVRFCQEREIEYEALAGPSALPLAYALSGFEGGNFSFYGFLPHKGKARSEKLNRILSSSLDSILYESPHRILKLFKEIVALDSKREIFTAKELTKRYQRYFIGTAEDILRELENSSIKGEWVVVIKGSKDEGGVLEVKDILELNVTPKAKAKLISKLVAKV